MYYIVYDNFLSSSEYGYVKQYMERDFPWKLQGRINNNDKTNQDRYFATNAYHAYEGGWQDGDGIERNPFITISSKLHIHALFRIKGNLYFPSRTSKVEHHAKHSDTPFKHQGALFFLTTCDAPTTMADGTEIESIENRLLLFDPVSMHSSSSPTNAPYRITINFNYFGADINKDYRLNMINPIPILCKNEHKVNDIHNLEESK